ncbi:MAG: heme NO-binding domain-containing protein [Jhaorihella sp.]
MHGLINRAIQSFVCDAYGAECWQRACERAALGFTEFEAMLNYDDAQSRRLLAALGGVLGRDPAGMLEDLGTYLVSHPRTEALRRLLRFGGLSYVEFLHSLDDLPDRARLAVADLRLPAMELREYASGRFSLVCGPGLPGFCSVMTGILRAMADDYGALVTLEQEDTGCDGAGVIAITLVETAFAAGRRFDLGASA